MAEVMHRAEETLVTADCAIEYLQSVALSIHHRSRDGQVIRLTEVLQDGLEELNEMILTLEKTLKTEDERQMA